MNTKLLVLELLENSRGKTLSGEYLAGLLNVSRNAIWKAIKDLKKDGYKIIAVTNKGYCLSDENDIISVQGIKPFLSYSSQPYSEKIYVYQSLESTNKTAKEMAIAGAEHGTIVIANQQTAGKGRYSRSFFSPAGSGLYMSFVLRPEQLPFQNATTITAFAAAAVCEAIECTSEKNPQIKWVNDIFIDGKKVCGILTEAVTDFESGNIGWIVLGIGINVSTHKDDFPKELQKIAISIHPEKDMSGARNKLAAEVINNIVGLDSSLDENEILDKYKKRLMMLGKEVTVIEGQTSYKATAIDIDSAFHLVVKNEEGKTLTLSSGEICI